MPPHIPVKRLTDLALKVAGECVNSYCKNLRTTFPCKKKTNDALSAPGCREAVQEVQDYLQGIIATMVWDSLFQSVFALHAPESLPTGQSDSYYCGVMDELFILAVFIYNNVFLKNIRIRHLLFDKKCVHQQRIRHFWLENAPKLANLVEADLCLVKHKYEDVVLAFGHSCLNLKILKMDFSLSDNTKNSVFRSCRQLLELRNVGRMSKESLKLLENLERVDYCDMDHVIELFEEHHVFKLKSLRLNDPSPQRVEQSLKQCPELNELRLCCYNNSGDVVLNAVSSSSPTLRNLTLQDITVEFDSFDTLLTSQGKPLETLVIRDCEITQLVKVFQLIGNKCPGLTSLILSNIDYSFERLQESSNLIKTVSFQNLQHLYVGSFLCDLPPPMLTQFVSQVVKTAVDLVSLEMHRSYSSGDFDWNDWLAELFSSEGARQLQKVVLHFGAVNISLGVTKLICGMCPKLRYLYIARPTSEVNSYLMHLSYIAKLNNFDLVVKGI